MKSGDTFQVVNPKDGLDEHLWVIISEPAKSDKVLMVNFTSHAHFKDQSCILDVGDHDFIKHKTCVNYSDPKIVTKKQLESLVQSGLLQNRKNVGMAILNRILDGAAATDRISFEAEEILVEQGIIQARPE